jgi:hypothetical protein
MVQRQLLFATSPGELANANRTPLSGPDSSILIFSNEAFPHQ